MNREQLKHGNEIAYQQFCELARDEEFRKAVFSVSGFRFKNLGL